MARTRARSVSAFGRGGIDETLMGSPRIDIYKSTGDTGMVRTPRNGDTGMERRDWRSLQRAVGQPQNFKRGGKVKKTGLAKVHKGERVLGAKIAKKVTPAKIRAAARKPTPRRRPR